MRVNPRSTMLSLTLDQMPREAAFREFLHEWAGGSGLLYRSGRRLFDRWAHKLGLLRRWRREERAATAKKKADALRFVSLKSGLNVVRIVAPVSAPHLDQGMVFETTISQAKEAVRSVTAPIPKLNRAARRAAQAAQSTPEAP